MDFRHKQTCAPPQIHEQVDEKVIQKLLRSCLIEVTDFESLGLSKAWKCAALFEIQFKL